MASITDTLTYPASFPRYLGSGFVGGYLGFFLVEKYKNQAEIDFMSTYALESGVAGLAGTYIAAMLGSDVTSMWKGALIGFGAEFLFNKYLKNLVAPAS